MGGALDRVLDPAGLRDDAPPKEDVGVGQLTEPRGALDRVLDPAGLGLPPPVVNPDQDPRGTAYGVDGTNLNKYGGSRSPDWMPKPIASAQEFMDGLGRMIHQGVTLGFGDELNSFLVGAVESGIAKLRGKEPESTREELLEQYQRENAAFRGDHPVGAMVGEVAGGGMIGAPVLGVAKAVGAGASAVRAGVSSAAAGGSRLAQGAKYVGQLAAHSPAGWVASTASKAPRALKLAGVAGIEGGLYGAGSADIGESRAEGATLGAAGGLAAGVLLPFVLRAGVGAVRGVKARFKPDQYAMDTIRVFNKIDSKTSQQLVKDLEYLGPQVVGGAMPVAAGTARPMVADVAGEGVQALGARSIRTIGEERQRVTDIYETRAAGEQTRLSAAVRRDISPDDWWKSEEDLLSGMKLRSDPVYREAYRANRSMMTPQLANLLDNRPALKTALRRSATTIRNAGSLLAETDKELGQLARQAAEWGQIKYPTGGVAKGLDLRVLDYTKRELDRMIGLEKNGTRRTVLIGLKNEFLAAIDKADKSGNYAIARGLWSSDIEALTALEAGRRILKMQPEQVERALVGMSESAQTAFRAGAARSILEEMALKAREAASTGIAGKILPNSAAGLRLRALVKTQDEYDDLVRALETDKTFTKSVRSVLRDTGARLPEEKKTWASVFGNLGAVLGSMTPGGGHALVKAGIGRRIAMGLAGKKGDVHIARLLLEQDISKNKAFLEALEAAPDKDVFIRRMIDATTLAVTQQIAMSEHL